MSTPVDSLTLYRHKLDQPKQCARDANDVPFNRRFLNFHSTLYEAKESHLSNLFNEDISKYKEDKLITRIKVLLKSFMSISSVSMVENNLGKISSAHIVIAMEMISTVLEDLITEIKSFLMNKKVAGIEQISNNMQNTLQLFRSTI